MGMAKIMPNLEVPKVELVKNSCALTSYFTHLHVMCITTKPVTNIF